MGSRSIQKTASLANIEVLIHRDDENGENDENGGRDSGDDDVDDVQGPQDESSDGEIIIFYLISMFAFCL